MYVLDSSMIFYQFSDPFCSKIIKEKGYSFSLDEFSADIVPNADTVVLNADLVISCSYKNILPIPERTSFATLL